MKNIKYISDQYMCSACGACAAICPKDSISFKKTSLGRLYPIVSNTCVDCGLCVKVCPSFIADKKKPEYYSLNKRYVVTGKSSFLNYQLNGQSGGAVTSVLTFLFSSGKIDAALLCRPVANGDGMPYLLTNVSQLSECQKSIYTPVPLLSDCLRLRSFKSVAVVGLPCHLSGLRKIMALKNIPVKYMLGLICDGNLCGGVSDGISSFFKVTDAHITWKDKNISGYYYHNAPVSVVDHKGDVYLLHQQTRIKLKQCFTPLRCWVCPDKLNISADLVFGDPWNLSIDKKTGESLMIANTSLGEEILRESINKKSIIVTSELDELSLDQSQNISGRRERVKLYTTVLSNSNNKSFLLNTDEELNVSLKELLRAIYNVLRFRILESLPKAIVVRYSSILIGRINKQNNGAK